MRGGLSFWSITNRLKPLRGGTVPSARVLLPGMEAAIGRGGGEGRGGGGRGGGRKEEQKREEEKG